MTAASAVRDTAAMPPIKPAVVARRVLATGVFNTVIALAITVVSGESFAVNLVYSQFIGMSIWVLIDGGRYLLNHTMQGPNSRENAMALLIGENIPVAQLAEIDRKLDDGNPLRGAVEVLSGEEELCTTLASQWDEEQGANCAALYIIR